MIESTRIWRVASIVAIAALVADSALAATFSLTGVTRDKRGQIELPLPAQLGGIPPGIPNVPGATARQTGPAVSGGGPATITIDTSQFFDAGVVRGFLVPIPAVIQLITTFTHYAPTQQTTLMVSRTGPANFSFCPGAAANPSCTTSLAGGNQGTIGGLVKYVAGPNKFGGTFHMLLKGAGNLVNKGSALPATVMTGMGGTKAALPFSALNGPLGGVGPIAHGHSYGFFVAGGGGGTAVRTHPYGYMTTPMGLLTPGPILGSGVAKVNDQTGFPMTTGVVYAYVPFSAQGDPAGAQKRTESGYDKRTANGAGRILLVSASLSRNYPTDGSDPPEGGVVNASNLLMNFTPQPALPVASPAFLVMLGGLVSLSMGFAVMRRR